MRILYRCGGGLDVHKESVVACIRAGEGAQARHEVRTFPTTTRGLLQLSGWLQGNGCDQVGMEATGVYWKPVWHLLEGQAELVLANAAHIRNVPGRKSDVSDAAWIADLLAHGLIRSSLVPPAPIQQLRELTRTRKQLTREIVQHVHRIEKVLIETNVRLTSVVTDMMGVSGRRILAAIAAGESDPERLADLGSERLHCSRAKLVEALEGRVTEHHRFLLRQHLHLIEQLEGGVADFDERIEVALEPFRDAAQRLTGIPGVGPIAARVIVAEIGADMAAFPTAGHLLSWAGLCPRMDESAGVRRATRVRPGAPWPKPVLVQCAWAASRSRETYLHGQYLRIQGRRGAKKAAVAVAASILTAAYHMLRDQAEYRDLGAAHLLVGDKRHAAQRLARRIRSLGFTVRLDPLAQAVS